MSSRWRTWRSTNRLANVRTKSTEAWTYKPPTYINDITWVFTNSLVHFVVHRDLVQLGQHFLMLILGLVAKNLHLQA